MESTCVTIAGFSNCYGREPFRIDTEILCEKDPDNSHDCETIKVIPIPHSAQWAVYIANSIHTRTNGTMSAAGSMRQLHRPRAFCNARKDFCRAWDMRGALTCV